MPAAKKEIELVPFSIKLIINQRKLYHRKHITKLKLAIFYTAPYLVVH